MRNRNKGLNPLDCFGMLYCALRFEQTHIRVQNSSKHFNLKLKNFLKIYVQTSSKKIKTTVDMQERCFDVNIFFLSMFFQNRGFLYKYLLNQKN